MLNFQSDYHQCCRNPLDTYKLGNAFQWCSIEYPMGHLHFLSIHTRLKAHVYTKKILVTRGKFHGIPLETIENTVSYVQHMMRKLGVIANEPVERRRGWQGGSIIEPCESIV